MKTRGRFLSIDRSNLRLHQTNEKMARVGDQFETCVTMTWVGMLANGTALAPDRYKMRILVSH
jgi:hypothetical protein